MVDYIKALRLQNVEVNSLYHHLLSYLEFESQLQEKKVRELIIWR